VNVLKLYDNALSTTTTTVLYTSTGLKTLVKQILISNTSGAAQTWTMKIGATQMTAIAIPANTIQIVNLTQDLNVGETILGGASATSVYASITGVTR
jgi:hypothetical protein